MSGELALRQVDLNLLAVLQVLVEQRSVSEAAKCLGLSQSATSHALQRLRHLLDDEVLVRGAGMMQPTPAALRVVERLRPALAEIAAALNEKSDFDPATSSRSFVLRVSEYVAPTLLAPLCTILRRCSPGIRLNVLPVGIRQERGIEPGELQIRAERGRRSFTRPTSRTLFEDEFVVVMSSNHPAAKEAMTLGLYVSLPHLKVTADAVGTNMIDEALERLGLRRNVMMSVPSWFEMRRVVLETDLVAVAPRHWIANSAFSDGFSCRELPLQSIALSVEMLWHARDEQDAGMAWFRGSVEALLATPA